MSDAESECRICLQPGEFMNIFDELQSLQISEQVMNLAKISIYPDDGLPNKICEKCVHKLEICINFIQLCKDSDCKLRSIPPACLKTKGSVNKYSLDKKGNLGNDLPIEIDQKDNFKAEKKKIRQKVKHQCPTCGKFVSSSHRLKTHLRTHSGERPYSCQFCKKTFSLQPSLKIHLLIHTGEKPLKCDECGEHFRQRSGLITHKRKHTGQKPYSCNICTQNFATFGNLQYHLRQHTGEKNFECDTCGCAFVTNGQLKQHIACHLGERPHVCSVCGLRLTRASNLRRHMSHMHNNQERQTRQKKITKTLKVDQSKEQPNQAITQSASEKDTLTVPT